MILAGLLGFATLPVSAHHSFAAQYDASKLIAFRGVVTRMVWINPHALLYLDVTDDSGKVTPWEFELGSPNGLRSAGWTPNTLKKGDSVTVRAFRAKDAAHFGNVFSIDMADGRPVLKGDPSGRYPSAR